MITIIIIQRTLRVRTQSVKIFDFECSIRGSKSKILSSQIPDLNWKPSVYKTDALPIVLIWLIRNVTKGKIFDLRSAIA